MTARFYGNLRLIDGGAAWEMAEAEPHVCIRLKHLFPRIPKASTGPFRFPNDLAHAADLDWFTQRYPMAMDDVDRQALTGGRLGFEAQQAEMERIRLPDYRPPPCLELRPGKALRDYQATARDLLGLRKSLLLGDEVGLGKTISAIGALFLPDALPAIIVVQPHLQGQWAEKIGEFTSLRVHQVKDTKAKNGLKPADVFLFRYSNIAAWVDVIAAMDVGLGGWDEIQELRTGTATAKGAASWELARRAQYRLGLTATPIYNYGVEIHTIMRFIDDTVLGDGVDFIREWTNGTGYVKDPRALGTYLRERGVFLRRTRADVGRELPPVNKVIEQVDYDDKVVASIEALAYQLAIRATSGDFVERGQAARELDARVRHSTGLAKAPYVADFVRILLESGEPVLLVGWHRDVYDTWLKKLSDFKPAMYTGSESAAQKETSKQRFLSGDTDLMIISLRSGAGLDGLQDRCGVVVFGELDWSPGIHHQVIGRLDRERSDGQQNQVMALFLVTEEGSDPPMMEVLGLKASESTQIVDPHLGVQTTHSDETHLHKLVQRYLAKRRHGKLAAPIAEVVALSPQPPQVIPRTADLFAMEGA